jgi:hypothetical protein
MVYYSDEDVEFVQRLSELREKYLSNYLKNMKRINFTKGFLND